jgi:hypothetical protein
VPSCPLPQMAEMLSPIKTTEGGPKIGFSGRPAAITALLPQTPTDATYQTATARVKSIFRLRVGLRRSIAFLR